MTYKGGCHCGRIAFEAEGDIGQLMECNCSICSKRGYLHWFVPRDKFTLLTPESELAAYTFRTGKLKHHYCSNCGCGPFIIGPEMLSVNARCLDGVDLSAVKVQQFDGRSL